MKSFNHDIGATAFFGLLVATVLAVPLAAFLHRDAHGEPDGAAPLRAKRALWIRFAPLSKGKTAASFSASTTPSNTATAETTDIRRCTRDSGSRPNGTAPVPVIGFFSRLGRPSEDGLPFWTGDGL